MCFSSCYVMQGKLEDCWFNTILLSNWVPFRKYENSWRELRIWGFQILKMLCDKIIRGTIVLNNEFTTIKRTCLFNYKLLLDPKVLRKRNISLQNLWRSSNGNGKWSFGSPQITPWTSWAMWSRDKRWCIIYDVV